MNSRHIRACGAGATALVLITALAGCSTMSVSHDYDKNVTWEKFTTYGWLASENTLSANVADARVTSDLLDQRIRKAVASEMGKRGIKAADSPDILIKYFIGTEEKVQVTDWGYRYSDYYWGYGGRQIDVYQFTQGTLILDIVDAGTKTLVWRGTATGAVDGGQKSPEEKQARVDKVVGKILENFPPR